MLHLCGALKPVATAVNHTGGQKSPGCTCTVHFDCAATGNYALHLLDALKPHCYRTATYSNDYWEKLHLRDALQQEGAMGCIYPMH
jgi:hypothetical protein